MCFEVLKHQPKCTVDGFSSWTASIKVRGKILGVIKRRMDVVFAS